MGNISVKFKAWRIPLKYKLMSMFAVIVVLMAGVRLVSYFSLRSTIGKLKWMIRTTIIANEIIKPAEEIPTGLSNYFMNRDDDQKQQIEILSSVSLLTKMAEELKGSVQRFNL
jgi:hypothetical protein